MLFHTGSIGKSNTEPEDWQLLAEWLATTDCGLAGLRRGLILDGDQACEIGAHPTQGLALDFVHDVLGAEYISHSYREHNQDDAYCVYLEPSAGAVFAPLAPGVALYGSGCPQRYGYNVLGLQPGVTGALGNLRFHSPGGTGAQPYVDYAQIVRRNVQPGTANWMSVVNGFGLHQLAERGCGGEPCSNDSACVVAGGLDVFLPLLDWMQDAGDPFAPWNCPCEDSGLSEPPATHPGGAVDFLHAPRPNPFHLSATLRFHIARSRAARLEIFDAGGRLVRVLHDGPLEAGEHNLAWDGADAAGRPMGAGLFWARLRTADGYTSSRRLVVLR